jgi:hypothetical protein
VKLSNQIGPLGGFERADGERLALLWNLTKDLTTDEIIKALVSVSWWNRLKVWAKLLKGE